MHYDAHMLTEADIAHLIRCLAEAKGWKITHASRVATGSGDTVERIECGVGLTIRRANAIIRKCDAVWPDGHPWPAHVPRPAKASDLEAPR